jgi:hypothetical protein
VDRFDADGIGAFTQESTNPPIPGNLKKHLLGAGTAEMPMPSASQAQERQQAQHVHHHARHTASGRVEHLLRAMAARVS